MFESRLDDGAAAAVDLSSASSRSINAGQTINPETCRAANHHKSTSFLIENILKSQAGKELIDSTGTTQLLPVESNCTHQSICNSLRLRLGNTPLVSSSYSARAEEKTSGKGKVNSADEQAKRRGRTMFSEWQLKSLEWRFERNKYLTTRDRIRLANSLQLDQLQVKTWFQVSIFIALLCVVCVRVCVCRLARGMRTQAASARAMHVRHFLCHTVTNSFSFVQPRPTRTQASLQWAPLTSELMLLK